MKKKKNIVPLKDLNLTDRFLFDDVIPLLDQPQTEKELRVRGQRGRPDRGQRGRPDEYKSFRDRSV